jgi:hypothetical protein
MSELKRIQNDIEKGYTVTRFGTYSALYDQMFADIRYLSDLAKNNEVLDLVSKCCDICNAELKHPPQYYDCDNCSEIVRAK